MKQTNKNALLKRIKTVEKKVAELEEQVQEQPNVSPDIVNWVFDKERKKWVPEFKV